jgi:glycine cleavage system H protein
VESVKAVSELVSPVGGEVIEANDALSDDPAVINESPFEKGWLIRIKITDSAPLDELMDADTYAAYRSEADR